MTNLINIFQSIQNWMEQEYDWWNVIQTLLVLIVVVIVVAQLLFEAKE